MLVFLAPDAIESLRFAPALQVVTPGTGGEECLRRCGLDFQAVST